MPSERSNLENLVRARQLNAEPADKRELANLLWSADQVLRDSRKTELSVESRFSLAYNAAHSLALAALRAAGYRRSSSGDRIVLFQVLEITANAPRQLALALAQYHVHRNKVEYAAHPVTATETNDLIKLAGELQALVEKRVKRA